MRTFRCSVCNTTLEEMGMPQLFTYSEFPVEEYRIAANKDPFILRGLICDKCKKVYCPSCAGMQRNCPTCNATLMPAHRGLLTHMGLGYGAQSIHTPVPKLPLNNWALASFILSLLSLCGGLLTGVPAIVLGFVALRKIAASEGQARGKELAWTGIIVGSVLAAISVFFILVALLSDISAR